MTVSCHMSGLWQFELIELIEVIFSFFSLELNLLNSMQALACNINGKSYCHHHVSIAANDID